MIYQDTFLNKSFILFNPTGLRYNVQIYTRKGVIFVAVQQTQKRGYFLITFITLIFITWFMAKI